MARKQGNRQYVEFKISAWVQNASEQCGRQYHTTTVTRQIMAESSSRNILASLKDKLHLRASSTTSPTASQGVSPSPNTDPDEEVVRQERRQHILSVFEDVFGELRDGDPGAFQTKFRKMAASPFAFYRGSAPLFYSDLAHESTKGPFLDERTSRIWVHGDLHAENFGTYMDSHGKLVFNVNDFDEAYIGPFTWDLYRLVASLALLGYKKALSDDQISDLVSTCATAYRERIRLLATNRGDAKRFTLDTSEGPLLKALKKAKVQSRIATLDGSTKVVDGDRKFDKDKKVLELDKEMKDKLATAFAEYLDTLPPNPTRGTCKIKDSIGKRGVGIGSAGLPSYKLLVEGHAEALEYDRIIFLKQSQPSAVSRYVDVPAARAYFKHEGHRTVISQRALQDHADLWVGWAGMDGTGYMVSEDSPYAIDIEWQDTNDFGEIKKVVEDLGQATAMMHGAADEDSQQSGLVKFSTEHAIDGSIAKAEADFVPLLVDFAHKYAAKVRNDHALFVDMFRNGKVMNLSNQ